MEEYQATTDQGSQPAQEAPLSAANNHVEGTVAGDITTNPTTDPVANPTSVPVTSPHDVVVRSIPVLLAEMQELRQDFETKVKYDESKERLIDSLHKELQSYREGLHFKILRPIFIDLITIYDDLQKVIDVLQTKSSSADSQEILNLRSFQESIEETLSRNGVDAFEVEEDMFLASKQRVLRTVTTSDAAQDKHVARRVRKGFIYDNRVLRPEVVEIYKYDAFVL